MARFERQDVFGAGVAFAAVMVLVGVVALASRPSAPAPEPPQPPPSDEALKHVAYRFVKDRLRDPGSAEFTLVHVSRSSGHPVVCGYVNARNGFGGMSGRQQFISAGPGPATALATDFAPGEATEAWSKLCSDYSGEITSETRG